MKKLITILFLTLIVSSCSNDKDDITTNPSDLIIGMWNLETVDGVTINGNLTQFEFLPNGEFLMINGVDIEQGNWNLSPNQTEITINEDTYDIINLSNTDLKIFRDGYGPNYYSLEYTFKKIE